MGRAEDQRRVAWLEWGLRQERVWTPATRSSLAGAAKGAPKFPIWVWQEPGFGYFFGIEKSGYATAPTKREYRYGPFSKAQARKFLNELQADAPQGSMTTDAMLNTLLGGKGSAVIQTDVMAATLAEMWKGRGWEVSPVNKFPWRGRSKSKRAGTF